MDAEASEDSESSSSIDRCGMTHEELKHNSNMILYRGYKHRFPERPCALPVLGVVWRMPILRGGARTRAVPPRFPRPPSPDLLSSESDSSSMVSIQMENSDSDSSDDSVRSMPTEATIELRHRCNMGLYQRHLHRLPEGTHIPVRGVFWHLPSLCAGARIRRTASLRPTRTVPQGPSMLL